MLWMRSFASGFLRQLHIPESHEYKCAAGWTTVGAVRAADSVRQRRQLPCLFLSALQLAGHQHCVSVLLTMRKDSLGIVCERGFDRGIDAASLSVDRGCV